MYKRETDLLRKAEEMKTNRSITKGAAEKFKSDMGSAIEVFPGKSESWLMVGLEEETLYFKGSDEPAAIAEVSVYGSLNSAACNKMTELVTESVSNIFDISPSRIYVKYQPIDEWGWNGSNF